MSHALEDSLFLLPNLLQEGSDPHVSDLFVVLYVSLLLLALRLVADEVLVPVFQRALQLAESHVKSSEAAPPEQDYGLKKKAYRVWDDVWIALASGSLLVFSWVVVVGYNGGCTPWNTATCVRGWPHHIATKSSRWYYLISGGYYMYEMIGTALKVGTVLKWDMVLHHVITMAMMLCAYLGGLQRYGLMCMAMMDASNPLLHLAKALHTLELPSTEPLKNSIFNLFALTFLVARVLLPPLYAIKPAIQDGFAVLPKWSAIIYNGLLYFIYAMQMFWFYKIVQLGKKAKAGASKAKAS